MRIERVRRISERGWNSNRARKKQKQNKNRIRNLTWGIQTNNCGLII